MSRKGTKEPELVVKRVVSGPPERAFRAWTSPEELARWFGPRGFTASCEADVRPEGAYRIVMRSPEGVEYPIKGFYGEVRPYRRLVCTVDLSEHPASWRERLRKRLGPDAGDPAATDSLMIVRFRPAEGGTEVSVETLFKSKPVRDAMLGMEMLEGWAETLERLGEHLQTLASAPPRRRARSTRRSAPRSRGPARRRPARA